MYKLLTYVVCLAFVSQTVFSEPLVYLKLKNKHSKPIISTITFLAPTASAIQDITDEETIIDRIDPLNTGSDEQWDEIIGVVSQDIFIESLLGLQSLARKIWETPVTFSPEFHKKLDLLENSIYALEKQVISNPTEDEWNIIGQIVSIEDQLTHMFVESQQDHTLREIDLISRQMSDAFETYGDRFTLENQSAFLNQIDSLTELLFSINPYTSSTEVQKGFDYLLAELESTRKSLDAYTKTTTADVPSSEPSDTVPASSAVQNASRKFKTHARTIPPISRLSLKQKTRGSKSFRSLFRKYSTRELVALSIEETSEDSTDETHLDSLEESIPSYSSDSEPVSFSDLIENKSPKTRLMKKALEIILSVASDKQRVSRIQIISKTHSEILSQYKVLLELLLKTELDFTNKAVIQALNDPLLDMSHLPSDQYKPGFKKFNKYLFEKHWLSITSLQVELSEMRRQKYSPSQRGELNKEIDALISGINDKKTLEQLEEIMEETFEISHDIENVLTNLKSIDLSNTQKLYQTVILLYDMEQIPANLSKDITLTGKTATQLALFNKMASAFLTSVAPLYDKNYLDSLVNVARRLTGNSEIRIPEQPELKDIEQLVKMVYVKVLNLADAIELSLKAYKQTYKGYRDFLKSLNKPIDVYELKNDTSNKLNRLDQRLENLDLLVIEIHKLSRLLERAVESNTPSAPLLSTHEDEIPLMPPLGAFSTVTKALIVIGLMGALGLTTHYVYNTNYSGVSGQGVSPLSPGDEQTDDKPGEQKTSSSDEASPQKNAPPELEDSDSKQNEVVVKPPVTDHTPSKPVQAPAKTSSYDQSVKVLDSHVLGIQYQLTQRKKHMLDIMAILSKLSSQPVNIPENYTSHAVLNVVSDLFPYPEAAGAQSQAFQAIEMPLNKLRVTERALALHKKVILATASAVYTPDFVSQNIRPKLELMMGLNPPANPYALFFSGLRTAA